MKTQRQSPCLALWLSVVEATQWCQLRLILVFKLETTLTESESRAGKTSVVLTLPSRFCKSTTLLIAQAAWSSHA